MLQVGRRRRRARTPSSRQSRRRSRTSGPQQLLVLLGARALQLGRAASRAGSTAKRTRGASAPRRRATSSWCASTRRRALERARCSSSVAEEEVLGREAPAGARRARAWYASRAVVELVVERRRCTRPARRRTTSAPAGRYSESGAMRAWNAGASASMPKKSSPVVDLLEQRARLRRRVHGARRRPRGCGRAARRRACAPSRAPGARRPRRAARMRPLRRRRRRSGSTRPGRRTARCAPGSGRAARRRR